jgi:beta-lactam-binding protein with PASTA domain
VTVPDVRGQKVFDATKTLTEAKLTLNPVVKEQVSSKPPGSIIDQTPKPGEKVAKNSSVSVLQAVGSGNIKVPDVVGKTFADASKALDGAKLVVGPVNPQPPDPALKVKSTIPAAGETVKEGKAISVFLAPKNAGKGNGKGAAAAGGAGAAGAGGTGKADIVIPAIAGMPVDAYAGGLAKLKLTPVQSKVFTDQAKPGTLFATDPPGGTKVAAGATVKLLVSNGIPQVAFDNDKDIVLVNGITGKKIDTVSKSPAREQEPSFNATGSALAFVSGGQLLLSNRTKPADPPVPLTSGSDQWRLPTFAPTPTANVLAALKLIGNTGGGDLCVGKVDKSGFSPQCLPKPKDGIGFGNAIHWAPDGKALFAFGRTSTGKAGIYRYTTATAFSAAPSDYNAPKLVTDSSSPGKYALDLAIAPDGKQMAVIGNFDSGRLQVYLTKAGDFTLSKAKLLPIEACTLTWRPDSAEIAIVQAAQCGDPGRIARVAIKDPRRSVQLGISGNAPTYSPVAPDAGKSP